ncbi:hypothetical protein AV530_009943 [Patagioenas fasciata monilis]|uniref:Uncharacterized protein n=1 Tax=Patagioenas fasciata monilis TaxID=372326 RepID=A0A1V4KAY6_PATFA|nr:hypothetical protein AV530_009943 [Patagioenas fasciata monilis]
MVKPNRPSSFTQPGNNETTWPSRNFPHVKTCEWISSQELEEAGHGALNSVDDDDDNFMLRGIYLCFNSQNYVNGEKEFLKSVAQ